MTKNCKECGSKFNIAEEDISFYEKISPEFAGEKQDIPTPKLCPSCRQQRRLAFRNERGLYRRKCDATGKAIISMYPEGTPFPVFDNDYWWMDQWDGIDYGIDFDFNKSLSENFLELFNKVPKMARIQQGENQNSSFCNCASYNKNSYLIFSSNQDEDCLYGTLVNSSKSCVDNFSIFKSELCYECINCENCYNLRFSENCKNSSDSYFLKNCIGCSNCFGCVNLNNKKYCYFNEQLSKEDYEEKTKNLDFSYKNLEKLKDDFEQFKKKFPNRYMEGVQTEDSSGNYLSNCKNSRNCFDARYLWDCAYCSSVEHIKNSLDVDHYGATSSNELLYECEGVGHGVFEVLFSKLVWGGSSRILCSYECFKSSNLFACTGLKNKSYCILNKQYSKQEYEKLVPKIISHMKDTGEWGEFFPIKISPFNYNETIAQEYFPLTIKEALLKGLKWKKLDEKIGDVTKVIPAERLPNKIEDIPDDVLNWAIRCEKTGRPYKIQKSELSFYRKLNLPIPHLHPDERHKERMNKRNPRKLWDRNCNKCNKEIQTTFSPARPEKVLCEECYLEEVY